MERERPGRALVQRVSSRAAFHLVVPVLRTAEEKREVYGFLSVAKDASGTTVTDTHGSQISVDELERMAHRYLVEARGVGEQHQRFEGIGHVIESVVLTREKQAAIPPKGIPEGNVHEGWFVGFRVDDQDTWGRLKRGELTGLSIGGYAKRVPGAVTRAAAEGVDTPEVHQLTDLEIVEGSLVDRPANPLCLVALFKRAGAAPKPETPRMFKKLTEAIAGLRAKLTRSDVAASPPTTNQLLLQDEFHERWDTLYGAYSESCWRIYDAGLDLPQMLEQLAKTTEEFLGGMEQLRQQLSAGAAEIMDVAAMDAALSTVMASASAVTTRESFAQVLKDVDATVKANIKPLPAPSAGQQAGSAAPTEKSMNTQVEVEKALAVERAEKEALKKALEEANAKAAEATALAKAAADKAETEQIQKRAEDVTMPGLSTAELVTVIRSVKGTPAEALLEKAMDASTAAFKKSAQPVGTSGDNAAVGADARWEHAVSAVQKRDGLDRKAAFRRAMDEHKDLFRATRKDSSTN